MTQPKVLIVDDDPICLRSLQWQLRSQYQVVLARSGEEALHKLKAGGARYQMALIDRLLMDMHGEQLICLIHNMPGYQNLPCVMLTGQADPEDYVHAIVQGASDFLYKPVENKLLKHVMAQTLKHDAVVC